MVDVHAGVEQRFGVNVERERKNREYMTGPAHGIHPLANGGGKGLPTVLREVDCSPNPAAPADARVFV